MKPNLTPSYLDEATPDDVAALAPSELAALQTQLADDKADLDRRNTRLHSGLVIRYGERVKAALAPNGQVGTTHVDDGDYDVTVNVPKTVEWDEDKLPDILDLLPDDLARHLAKVKVAIDERKFAAALPDIHDALRPARTVKPGKAKFEFKPRKQEAA